MFSAKSEAEREEMGVLGIEGMILECCNVPQVAAAARGGRGVEVQIEAGGLIMGGMEECTLGEREEGKGRERGGHLALHLLEKNLWGQPIRGWVTPLSSQLASKSCATRQPTCLCSMNV